METIDFEEATKRFVQRLDSGYYKRDRSQNTETIYSETKQARDTKAVEDFAGSALFKELYGGLEEN